MYEHKECKKIEDKLRIRIQKLERRLEDTASELEHMIRRENDRLKTKISAADMQPPDYIDFQTVYEAMELLSNT